MALTNDLPYNPNNEQYDRNLVTFVGSQISHLPTALFELMHELCRRYRRSDRTIVYPEGFCFHKETRGFYRWEDEDDEIGEDAGGEGAQTDLTAPGIFLPDAVILRVSSYSDLDDPGRMYLSLEMLTPRRRERQAGQRSERYQAGAAQDGRLKSAAGKAAQQTEQALLPGILDHTMADNLRAARRYLTAHFAAPAVSDLADVDFLGAALVLRTSGSMKSRYYYTAKRFQNANRGKYVVPGLKLAAGHKPLRVCVFDTEMERPYPIQFAGILLERREGEENWQIIDRFSTYIRLPEGTHLTRDVMRVTGIREEQLQAEGIPEQEADDKIQKFLSRADFLCGHAVLADKEIMRISFQRQQMKLPYSLRRRELIDTQLILERLYHLDNAVKLEYAAELSGVKRPEDTFHDARTDADVTARIFAALEPVFVREYQVEPVVSDAMMHAPQQTQLLGRFIG